MVTWARVVLLQDHPRRYELVQAYRIMTTVRPDVYRPRLARALGDLVDGFTAAAPADAVERLVTEAVTNLLEWARGLTRTSTTADIITDVVVRQRRRRAADDGPAWELLAVAVALEEAGRADAALTVVRELIERERRERKFTRLARALLHAADMLERRQRSYDAAPLREEGLRLLGEDTAAHPVAALLTATPQRAGTGKRPDGSRAGGTHARPLAGELRG
ncbi:hypothetical protein [Dactylosporangium sp. NPDC005555]|uniref:hypothetical protein n=1 Tax=Dactylosporangium sp. NPDC005555 TaxID=3154889 RepID=UPI00339FE217